MQKSGITDVSLRKLRQDGVPNFSTRIHADPRGYTDVYNCLCSNNTCSGKYDHVAKVSAAFLRMQGRK